MILCLWFVAYLWWFVDRKRAFGSQLDYQGNWYYANFLLFSLWTDRPTTMISTTYTTAQKIRKYSRKKWKWMWMKKGHTHHTPLNRMYFCHIYILPLHVFVPAPSFAEFCIHTRRACCLTTRDKRKYVNWNVFSVLVRILCVTVLEHYKFRI